MGYDVTRFAESSVDEELLCPICSGVLENPRQVEFQTTQWHESIPKCFKMNLSYSMDSFIRPAYITFSYGFDIWALVLSFVR